MYVRLASKLPPLPPPRLPPFPAHPRSFSLAFLSTPSLPAALLATLVDVHVPHLRALAAIVLLGLLLDIVCVALLKVLFRRSRPVYGNAPPMHVVAPVDAYSFPSGHASRSAMLATLLLSLQHDHDHPLPAFIAWIVPHLVPWALATALSRVLLRRHFVSDVTAGAALGLTCGIGLARVLSRYGCTEGVVVGVLTDYLPGWWSVDVVVRSIRSMQAFVVAAGKVPMSW